MTISLLSLCLQSILLLVYASSRILLWDIEEYDESAASWFSLRVRRGLDHLMDAFVIVDTVCMLMAYFILDGNYSPAYSQYTLYISYCLCRRIGVTYTHKPRKGIEVIY